MNLYEQCHAGALISSTEILQASFVRPWGDGLPNLKHSPSFNNEEYGMMYLLGIDLGSSSVNHSCSKRSRARASEAPSTRKGSRSSRRLNRVLRSRIRKYGTTEQRMPAVRDAMREAEAKPENVQAIGIAYQMHGLVYIDKDHNTLRPAIIWCDSRAVPYGQAAFEGLGAENASAA